MSPYPTFVLDKGDTHWLRRKDGSVCVCVCVCKVCVSVSILQGSGEVVCALWLSVKSSIVPFKTKELLCVQTQQAVASHSVELC